MSVTVKVHHACGHTVEVASPGPLDPDGLIKADAAKGLSRLGLAARACDECVAGRSTPQARFDGGRKREGAVTPDLAAGAGARCTFSERVNGREVQCRRSPHPDTEHELYWVDTGEFAPGTGISSLRTPVAYRFAGGGGSYAAAQASGLGVGPIGMLGPAPATLNGVVEARGLQTSVISKAGPGPGVPAEISLAAFDALLDQARAKTPGNLEVIEYGDGSVGFQGKVYRLET